MEGSGPGRCILCGQGRPVKETKKDEAEVRVVRMWNPSYRVNNGQYVSLEEYLKEFKRRLSGKKEKME